MAELRVRDLDDSATREEIAAAVCDVGKCAEGEVRVGAVRGAYDGLSIAWIRCPVAAANKIAAVGRVTVGWALCCVQLLAARPLQCYKWGARARGIALSQPGRRLYRIVLPVRSTGT
ncbi:uncharacterized protein LOC118646495 [Monomorium pharaonis]|uniref:uncharacterized protein LOC118646495 n=1 Tax=Monomorium pharaonis TaxID=307658 RepID=UPI0017472EEF|nr:uncharacterized protein LOC118646495 [Monomorium pharaonis]